MSRREFLFLFPPRPPSKRASTLFCVVEGVYKTSDKMLGSKKKKQLNSEVGLLTVYFIAQRHTKASFFVVFFFFVWWPFSFLLPEARSDTRFFFWRFNALRGCVSPSRVAVKQNHIPGDSPTIDLASRRPFRPDVLKWRLRPQSKHR